jgi:hypothetical protein
MNHGEFYIFVKWQEEEKSYTKLVNFHDFILYNPQLKNTTFKIRKIYKNSTNRFYNKEHCTRKKYRKQKGLAIIQQAFFNALGQNILDLFLSYMKTIKYFSY